MWVKQFFLDLILNTFSVKSFQCENGVFIAWKMSWHFIRFSIIFVIFRLLWSYFCIRDPRDGFTMCWVQGQDIWKVTIRSVFDICPLSLFHPCTLIYKISVYTYVTFVHFPYHGHFNNSQCIFVLKQWCNPHSCSCLHGHVFL